MKLLFLTNEQWIQKSIEEAIAILKDHNVFIDFKFITFDTSNSSHYEVKVSNSTKGKMETKTIKSSLIRSLGISYGSYDYYGLIVDKSKAKETMSLLGHQEDINKTIAIYARKNPKNKFELDGNTLSIVHEILHALADHYKFNDTLHDHINSKPKNLNGYLESIKQYMNKLKINDGIDANLKGKKATNTPLELIIHHTGGVDTNILADTSHHGFEMVKSFHKSKGWDTIGYHYFIEKDGDIWQGRPDNMSGAHCIGKNKTSIGICLAGNFDFTKPTEPQMASLKSLTKHLKAKYGINKISRHSDYANKTCPGKNFTDQMIKAL